MKKEKTKVEERKMFFKKKKKAPQRKHLRIKII